jgi:hypothetical protein
VPVGNRRPRAAWRLERLGFHPVYDYVAGKVDWMAAGLPTVRADAQEQRAIDVVVDVRTCDPATPAADLPSDRSVVVVNDDRIVLGRGRPGASAGSIAEDVMEPGPTTVRAHEPLEPLLQRMARRNVAEVLVTTPEGTSSASLSSRGRAEPASEGGTERWAPERWFRWRA